MGRRTVIITDFCYAAGSFQNEGALLLSKHYGFQLLPHALLSYNSPQGYAGRISTVAVERLVKTHAANTEAKAKTPHAFRRTYGSNLLNDEKYEDLGLTAELLNHSNPSTMLAFYSRASQERRKDASPGDVFQGGYGPRRSITLQVFLPVR